MSRRRARAVMTVVTILCVAVLVWVALGNAAQRAVPPAPGATTPSPGMRTGSVK